MQTNVGGTDRTARYVIGGLLLLVGVLGYAGMLPVAVGPLPQALTSAVLALAGLILVLTAWTQKCPINSAAGRNTAD